MKPLTLSYLSIAAFIEISNIMKPLTLSYLSIAAFIALISLVISAPVIDPSQIAELEALGFQVNPQMQYLPQPPHQQRLQKKWSRLEPSIRFFKRSGIPSNNFDLENEYFIVA
uniref:Uncharacterized protein n=2 Tax=Panagrolaimus sp. PS1159 TaxID=55785 RepID=A0AC35F6L2_9BILA